jgi:AhpD family alkylhydroperoxidase
MTRLDDPDPAAVPVDVLQFLAEFPPDPMVKMLTHSVATVGLFIQQAQAQFAGLALSARFRELVILVVATCTDCAFVAAQHGPISAAAGVTDALRDRIARRDFDSAELAPHDRTIIRFAAQVVKESRVSNELFADVQGFLSNREIVEILQICGYYWTFCRIATVLDVEVTTVYGAVPASNEL